MTEDEFDVKTLSAFLQCARYGSSERLAYPYMIAGCADHGVLLQVDRLPIKSWYQLELLRLIRDIEMDPVLALVVIGLLTEVDWDALGDQEWFPYKYAEGKTVVLLSKPPMMRSNSRGLEVREGVQPVVKLKYRAELATRGRSIELVCFAWRRYIAEGIYFKEIPKLAGRDALTCPAGPNNAISDIDTDFPEAR